MTVCLWGEPWVKTGCLGWRLTWSSEFPHPACASLSFASYAWHRHKLKQDPWSNPSYPLHKSHNNNGVKGAFKCRGCTLYPLRWSFTCVMSSGVVASLSYVLLCDRITTELFTDRTTIRNNCTIMCFETVFYCSTAAKGAVDKHEGVCGTFRPPSHLSTF